jgi:hypothetical protein
LNLGPVLDFLLQRLGLLQRVNPEPGHDAPDLDQPAGSVLAFLLLQLLAQKLLAGLELPDPLVCILHSLLDGLACQVDSLLSC